MEDNNLRSFSITALLLVSGFSCFLFYVVLKLMDGTHDPFFINAGTVGLTAGLVSFIFQSMRIVSKPHKKRKRQH